MDETNEQLIGEIRSKLPVAPGQPERREREYVRNGITQTLLEVEPLAGRRHVEPARGALARTGPGPSQHGS